MSNIIFYLLAIALILSSCAKKTANSTSEVVILTREEIPPLQYVEAEQIELTAEKFLCSKFYVYQDTILLAINYDIPNPTFLTMMNLKTGEDLAHYYPQGQGPDEMLSIAGFLDMNYLVVRDFPTRRLSLLNVDSAIIQREKYKPAIFSFKNDNYWYLYCMLTDSTMMVYNRNYAENAGEYNTNEVTTEFFISDLYGNHEDVFVPDTILNYTFTGGYIKASQKRRRVFCAYSRFPKYRIIDYDRNVIKTIYGPDEFENIKIICSDGLNVAVDGCHIYNSAIAANEDYVLVFNSRCINQPAWEDIFNVNEYNNALEEMEIENGELYKFDWDGNLLNRYKVKGTGVYSITFSEQDPKLIYFTGYNEDRELCLFKTRLP